MVTCDEERNKLLDVSSDDIHEFKDKIKKQMSECLNYDGLIKDKFNSMFTEESIYAEEENSDNTDSDNYYNENDINDILSLDNSEENEKELKIEKNLEFNYENGNKEKEEYPLYELLDKIGNPVQRMKNVLNLMKSVIKNIQRFFSEDTFTFLFSVIFFILLFPSNILVICFLSKNLDLSLSVNSNLCFSLSLFIGVLLFSFL